MRRCANRITLCLAVVREPVVREPGVREPVVREPELYAFLDMDYSTVGGAGGFWKAPGRQGAVSIL